MKSGRARGQSWLGLEGAALVRRSCFFWCAINIYALGATLFWLLTGEPAFAQGQKLSECLRNLQHNSARPLRTFCPEAPKELEDLLKSLLHHDPTRRPRLPQSVANALAPFADAGAAEAAAPADETHSREVTSGPGTPWA